MEVTDPNNVKIYNLSAGKSLPDWISDRKRRALQRKDVDIRRRIELIQDFDMPGVSTKIKISPDDQYILATGTYKPRVKCFDVNQMSIKFERCFDSEVVTFQTLSDDYSKLVFLHCDRYIEFHNAAGRYFRLRVPKFGRDLLYYSPTADLLVVGAGPDIYRLNLERGQFLAPFTTEASELGCCAQNEPIGMFAVGTREGKVEVWDPRSRLRAGQLDVAVHVSPSQDHFPSVTALKFQNAMTMGCGLATGQVLLFDIRGSEPLLVKDHMYGLPIRKVEFHQKQNLVLSMDSSALKIWHKSDGKMFTSIETKVELNDLCLVQDSGMLFMAAEQPKILTYYIPSMGAAPKWCGVLDTITEELEETKADTIYDDYKFVTRNELEQLGLSHLLGTSFLRAYMHGYFIDIRLYRKAKSLTDPFAFDAYKKKKIKDKIESERKQRVNLPKLPDVNKEFAAKLRAKGDTSLFSDDRFKQIFSNPEFHIDENADEYRMLHPVLSKDQKKKEKLAQISEQFEEVEEIEGKNSSEEESSSEDDEDLKQQLKATHKQLQKEKRQRERAKLFELKEGEEFKPFGPVFKPNRASLADRLANFEVVKRVASGAREMRFKAKHQTDEAAKKIKAKNMLHQKERSKIVRSAAMLLDKEKPRFWKGKRVN